jgi:F0F1-type ATP synthase membrane subunit c/vacuolar-type H+-ATPase subunit K
MLFSLILDISYAIMGAGIGAGLAAIGAGIGVGRIGGSAMGLWLVSLNLPTSFRTLCL